MEMLILSNVLICYNCENSLQKTKQSQLALFLATLAYMSDTCRCARLCNVKLRSTWASKYGLTCEKNRKVVLLMTSG